MIPIFIFIEFLFTKSNTLAYFKNDGNEFLQKSYKSLSSIISELNEILILLFSLVTLVEASQKLSESSPFKILFKVFRFLKNILNESILYFAKLFKSSSSLIKPDKSFTLSKLSNIFEIAFFPNFSSNSK